jgi:Holliday junction resolvase RusA-like endonuclease
MPRLTFQQLRQMQATRSGQKERPLPLPLVTPARQLTLCTVIIPGEPKGKARARVFWDRKVNRMVAKTPEDTVAAEKHIAEVVGLRLRTPWPDAYSRFGVEGTFYVGDRRRRDADNLGKLVLDALNKRIWADDSQVYDIHFRKDDTDLANPRTELRIYRIV